ncbi:MAG: hypothetical protein K1X47_04675, partial [Cyclobacteriaceae bacterium]|nr:hypothetical protein [Cyclobacteriaceae bacterium]
MKRMMKLMLALVATFCIATGLLAQSTGDFRSNNAAMTWTTAAQWQTWNGSSWVAAGTYPGQSASGAAVLIQDGHTVTLDVSPANTLGSLTVGSGASGVLIIGNSATNRTLTVTGNVAVAVGGTLRSGANSATGHVLNIGGSLTNNGTVNLFFSTDVCTAVFTGASPVVSGSGATFTFRNLTRSTSGTSITVSNSIRVEGTLDLAVNSGTMIVGTNANLTMGQNAVFAATGGTLGSNGRYVQLDGLTGANSNLIKVSAGTTASWQITYPIGTSNGGYTPLVLGTVTNNPTAAATLSIKAIYNNSNQGQLRRQFRAVVAGNSGTTTFSNLQFSYSSGTDVSTGDAIANYSTIWSLSSTGGSWATAAGTAPGVLNFTITGPTATMANGTYYYTIGSSTAYPNTWYSYQTGVWSNWQNWTLDPSGSSLVNGLNLPPQPGDAIVILNGITITNDVSGQVTTTATINGGGILDMSTTTGNTLGTVTGTGTLRINGINLPTGTYTTFVSTLGGTIEYYNTSGTLPTGQTTYNKLKLSNSTGSAITFTLLSNLTVNSTFDITATSTGTVTWQINDATATQRTITLNGDLTVSSNGRIRVGTGT